MTVWGLGVEEGMTKVALRRAHGGLDDNAPAALTNLKQTTQAASRQQNVTAKAVVKPPPTAQAKPLVKPLTQTQVAPTTISIQPPTPPQATPQATKTASIIRKKKRDRTTGGEPRTGGEPQRPGEDMSMKHPAPGNNPVTYTNGKPHDF